MAVCVTYECHTQTYISGGLDAGLQYLRCVSDGDAAVLHPAIDIVSISVSISMMTLCIDMKLSICVSLKWQYVWHEYHMQTYISWWLCAGMQYLPCISNRDAVVLHWAIDTGHGQWPGAWLSPGHCLFLRWHHVYPWNKRYVLHGNTSMCDIWVLYARSYTWLDCCETAESPVL